jgi:3-oxoacyl-[acyl-carrier-protein] synthase II
MAPSTACAAGASAIADAAAAIAAGTVDAALAGGAEAAIEPLTIAGFARMRALAAGGGDNDSGDDDPASLSRPFDAGRAGFVLGEGAAVLVLEAEEAAAARGAAPLAYLAGAGASADAHHPAQPPPDGAGAAAAMRAALADAGLSPADVCHVSAHATSTPAGDAAEAAALRTVFGGGGGGGRRGGAFPAQPPAVSSIKGAVGHLLGAAGALEAAMAVEALAARAAPPTINLASPDVGGCGGGEAGGGGGPPAFSLVGPAPGGAALEPRPGRPPAALSNSFGFGGVNVCLAFVGAH